MRKSPYRLQAISRTPRAVHAESRQPAFEAPRMGAGQAAGKDAREKAPVAVKLAAALLYGGASVAMNFVNKYTMQVFPLTNVVMVLQMVVTWVILEPMLLFGYLGFPSFQWNKARQLFWISMLYTGNTAFALVGLKTLNVPMYNVLKRLTPMMVLVVKAVIRKRWPSHQITAAVLLVVAGCIVAGIGDLTFDLWGYIFALLSCTSQAAYLLMVEFQGTDEGVSTSELLYYNAVTSLPLLLAVVWGSGEWAVLSSTYTKAVDIHGAGWVWSAILSCSTMGVALNYALFLCTTTNSALTTTIVGVLKGVIAVLLGFFLLGGVPFSWVNVTGITLNTLGGVWYTYIKFSSKGASSSSSGGGGHSGSHHSKDGYNQLTQQDQHLQDSAEKGFSSKDPVRSQFTIIASASLDPLQAKGSMLNLAAKSDSPSTNTPSSEGSGTLSSFLPVSSNGNELQGLVGMAAHHRPPDVVATLIGTTSSGGTVGGTGGGGGGPGTDDWGTGPAGVEESRPLLGALGWMTAIRRK